MSTVNSENATITTTTAAAITATTVVSTTLHSPKSALDSNTATMPDSAHQLPVNMSTQSPASAAVILTTPTNLTTITTAAATTTTTPRHNVSVTNIKCEMDELQTNSTQQINGNIVPVIAAHGMAYFNGSGGIAVGTGLRIPVPKAEESDSETELTNIENLKVTRRVTSTNGGGGVSVGGDGVDAESSNHSKNGPRPMSWEGELSENEINETEQMDTEHSLSNGAGAVSLAVIKSEATTTTTTIKPALDNLQYQSSPHSNTPTTPPTFSSTTPTQLHHQQQQQQQSAKSKHSIKSELDQISVDMHNAGIYSSPHAKLKLAPTQSDPINLKYEPPDLTGGGGGGVNSPLLARSKTTTLPLPANPSPDSAIHSVYTHSSPSQSPLTSRHAPYTPSLSRNNSDASHSSCYSYSSEFSPTHSPIQARHAPPATAGSLYSSYNGAVSQNMLYRPLAVDGGIQSGNTSEAQNLSIETKVSPLFGNGGSASCGDNGLPSSPAGISRQQLINSPCPICGDKISGFHYGIFSCESCKGFFKRTVQNRKNYVCIRGGPCPVSISTRKKCPACRFEKCLQKGMKLEAIREDRTRGGRSTYQCSYTLPNTILNPLLSPEQAIAQQQQHQSQQQQQQQPSHATHSLQQQQQQRFGVPTLTTSSVPTHNLNGFVAINNVNGLPIKSEQPTAEMVHATNGATLHNNAVLQTRTPAVPTLLQEIMDVEHLWQYNEAELARLNQPIPSASTTSSTTTSSATSSNQMTNTLLVSCGLSSNTENANPDWIAHLCNVADHRLYKIVKWCKSLPLFKHISIDDQIRLLINSWCELLLFSCCFRSVYTPGEIKLSQGKSITLAQAKSSGLQACIERMLNLTDHLRRLRVDRYEYVAMKVIVLLQSDTSELQEPVKVRECQEKALQSLQEYTHAHYPDAPSKFGELLLRIPDLQRTYQLGKEMLTIKSRDGGGSDFNLLMELLRGEH